MKKDYQELQGTEQQEAFFGKIEIVAALALKIHREFRNHVDRRKKFTIGCTTYSFKKEKKDLTLYIEWNMRTDVLDVQIPYILVLQTNDLNKVSKEALDLLTKRQEKLLKIAEKG